MQIIRVMRHSIKEQARSSEKPNKINHVSKKGLTLAKKYAPIVLAGLGKNFPTYIGPEPRNRETGNAMGLKNMQIEKLFNVFNLNRIKPYLHQADEIMKKQKCHIVTALFQIPEVANVLSCAGKEYRKGILKIAKLKSSYSYIFVIGHGGSIEPAANIKIGLDYMDWVDFYVNGQRIIHTVVSRHNPPKHKE